MGTAEGSSAGSSGGTIMKLPLQVKDGIQVKANSPGMPVYYDSRVEEITDGELLISWPRKGLSRMPVREQQTIFVAFSREQRIYEFEASVLDVISEPAPLIAVRVVGPLRSIQRRDDYRARVAAPVELAPRVVRMAGFKEGRAHLSHILTTTVNVSAGGFSVHHPTPIAVGTVFEIKLTLPGESRQPMQMTGRVVHCTPMVVDPDAEPVLYDVGFTFTRISEPGRQAIVKLVFTAQREERRQD